jgi:asparagine synthase (glutamine-hydrolysing)
MSGICGLVDLTGAPADPETLGRMATASAYRNPQPLEGRGCGLRLVADVRLDNRAELMDLLGDRGLLSREAASDSEILLAAYLCWAESCVDHLLGDFALALWDGRERRFFCAVDPLGVKPLHYARHGALVLFATDALQILQHPGVPRDLDEIAVGDYLTNRVDDPARSFFRGVHRLPPGHRLTVTPKGERLERYWNPDPEPIAYSRDEDYAAHFRELFERAVADRLRTQGTTVGIAMSGGLDSTSVAAVARRIGGGPRVVAGSFVFPGLPECDEEFYIDSMARERALEIERIDAERFWDLEDVSPTPASPDTPFIGWHSCYGEMLRRFAGRGARVLLMGHGADDLLRGSALVYADRLRRGDLRAAAEVARHARERGEAPWRALYRSMGKPLLPERAHTLLRSLAGRKGAPGVPDWVRPEFAGHLTAPAAPRTARQEIHGNTVGTPWYNRIVSWHDRNAARFGIEVRHPFLDRRLFEYILAIPPRQLFELGVYKPFLRRAMAGVLPEAVRTRRSKTRFIGFLDHVMREREAARIEEMFRTPLSAELGIVDGARLRRAYQVYRAGERNETRSALWHAVTLEHWLRRLHDILQGSRRPSHFADSEMAA